LDFNESKLNTSVIALKPDMLAIAGGGHWRPQRMPFLKAEIRMAARRGDKRAV
jgi:hypothetical protein